MIRNGLDFLLQRVSNTNYSSAKITVPLLVYAEQKDDNAPLSPEIKLVSDQDYSIDDVY